MSTSLAAVCPRVAAGVPCHGLAGPDNASMHIDCESPVYPYLQLAAHLREQIESGEIMSRLPSLTELCEQTELSLGTVQRGRPALIHGRVIAELTKGFWGRRQASAFIPAVSPLGAVSVLPGVSAGLVSGHLALYPAGSLPVLGPACSSSRSVLVRSLQRIFRPPRRSTATRSRPLRVRPRRFTTSSMCVPPAGPGLVA
jgi:hypothetical protein